MSTLQIVRLMPQDAARLRALRLAALSDAPDAFGTAYTQAALLRDCDWAEQIRTLATFAARQNGLDVGLARGVSSRTEARLISLWVVPERRGKGVGSALVDAVLDWARADGAALITLDVTDDNARAADLYRDKGFLPTGHRQYFDPPRQHIAEYRMARKL